MTDQMSAVEAETIQASRLPQLIALAGEGSSEKRRLLLRELTDHFFGGVEHSAAETELYGSVLETLADEMETAVRAELAARFADAPNAPHSLIRRLANDNIDVAEPVLRASTVLTDEDLIGVVSKHGQDHMRAVSGRIEVPEAVSEIIVARGDDDTLGALLRNDGARLSRAASESAVERAKVNPALHAATVERKTLPADLLNEMYFVVEARLRHQILEQNARMDPELLEAALAAGRTRVATDDGALPPDYAESQAYVDELHAAGQLTPQVLIRFLRSKGRTPFLVALSRLSDVDFHTARGIVDRRDLDALSVVCKAADIDRAIYLTYAVSLLGADANPMGKAAAYGRMYGELTKEAALRTLRFWRMRRVAQAA
ncbi:DUF2336 domain-containing protein [Brevundimonas sp.]|jgi:uncharacterized protein (DUF2336 family)|uniref:DUF2336 domain-containing protein n=1 Tax=Brevundimonas sp. TaxID=1871086 RepID=UPI0037BE760A